MRFLLKQYLEDFAYLIFPQICAGCGEHLTNSKERICASCIKNFPYTHEDPKKNYLADKLMSLQPISGVFCLCYLNSGSVIQTLIHQMKYNNRKDVGFALGRILGESINHYLNQFDLITPVPLHKKKKAKRGFNQSELIAKGANEVLKLQYEANLIVRNRNTKTQTRKSRLERYENMKNAFSVVESSKVQRNKILLIDDVITTGSTALSCAHALFKTGANQVFLAAIGKADPF